MPRTNEEQIQDFLVALDNTHREAFLAYAENTYSVYEIWLYAGVLGYEGSFPALDKWIKKTHPKLNRREIMLAEIVKLEGDIDFLRQQVQADLIKADAAATRIAHLSKELRGHVMDVDKLTRPLERRGVIMPCCWRSSLTSAVLRFVIVAMAASRASSMAGEFSRYLSSEEGLVVVLGSSHTTCRSN